MSDLSIRVREGVFVDIDRFRRIEVDSGGGYTLRHFNHNSAVYLGSADDAIALLAKAIDSIRAVDRLLTIR